MTNCLHKNQEYIPPEEDTNVVENLICIDCGINLPLDIDWIDHFEQIKYEK